MPFVHGVNFEKREFARRRKEGERKIPFTTLLYCKVWKAN